MQHDGPGAGCCQGKKKQVNCNQKQCQNEPTSRRSGEVNGSTGIVDECNHRRGDKRCGAGETKAAADLRRRDAKAPRPMLSRANRLAREREVLAVVRRGRVFHSPTLLLRALRTRRADPRFAVVVGTKVSKKAVVRNLVKRRVRAILREKKSRFPSEYDYLISVRAKIVPTYRELDRDLRKLHTLLMQKR